MIYRYDNQLIAKEKMVTKKSKYEFQFPLLLLLNQEPDKDGKESLLINLYLNLSKPGNFLKSHTGEWKNRIGIGTG